jgi:hypothetical protein
MVFPRCALGWLKVPADFAGAGIPALVVADGADGAGGAGGTEGTGDVFKSIFEAVAVN